MRTAHFVLHTDLLESKAERLLRELERRYGGFAAWFGAAAEPARLEAVLFGIEAEYVKRFGRSIGIYAPRRGSGDVFVAYETRPIDLTEEVLTQAIARQLVKAKYPGLPGWLADGLTAYLGAAKLSESRLHFGGPPRSLGLEREVGSVAPVADLFGADDPESEALPARTRNTSAWALIGYLLDQSIFGEAAAARLQAWLALVNRAERSAESIAQAFADIYPERTLSDVDTALGGHARAAAGTRAYQHFVTAPEIANLAPEVHPPDPGLATLLTETEARVELARWNPVMAAEYRRWRTSTRRHHARIDGHARALGDLVGLAYSYSVAPHHAFDVELGWSPFGYFASPRYRAQLPLAGGSTFLLSLGLGPFYAVKNQTLGLEAEPVPAGLPAQDDSFHHFAHQAELSLSALLPQGVILRLSGTALLRADSNFGGFCRDRRFANNDACNPDSHFGPVSDLAKEDVVAFWRLGLGYAW